MPTYEYKCRDCGHHLEIVQSFTDDALTECPTCEGSLRKVFSPVGIAFKGSGFYKTDSRSGNGASSSSTTSPSEGSGSADSGSSSTASGDGKGSADKGSGSSDTGTKASEKKAPAKK